MARLEDYQHRFQYARFEREDGILQMTLHSDGDTLPWGAGPHTELPEVFHTIGTDVENKVIIMTGAGAGFTGPAGSSDTVPRRTPEQWDATYWEGKHLLNIEVPIIAAINGPALRHSELPLLSDIVLAAPHTTFQDSGHFMSGLTPGDGMHIIYPLLLGVNRGRYFLLTGQMLDAAKAQELGLVAEVLPADELLPRAWELARELARQPRLVLRYSRVLLTQKLRGELHDLLGYGLALEGLGSAQDYLDRGQGR